MPWLIMKEGDPTILLNLISRMDYELEFLWKEASNSQNADCLFENEQSAEIIAEQFGGILQWVTSPEDSGATYAHGDAHTDVHTDICTTPHNAHGDAPFNPFRVKGQFE